MPVLEVNTAPIFADYDHSQSMLRDCASRKELISPGNRITSDFSVSVGLRSAKISCMVPI